FFQQTFDRLTDAVAKLENDKLAENDKIVALTNEVTYLRQLLDFQNSKIEKLASLVADLAENKNQDAMINSLSAVQAHVLEHDNDHVTEVQDQVQQQVDQLQPQHDMSQQQVHLDSNMDPALHQVAVAAAAVQAQQAQQVQAQQQHAQVAQQQHRQDQHQHRQDGGEKARKKSYSNKRKLGEGSKPKITIDFLHNPMSVKEIYDEFTKGFRGQPALCEMDAKYGKHEWRGDSRSKESKRYQRRKKLCDAIERGMLKYGKPEEEIIRYIEEFRGEKSLTWVMNGNLPEDLLN
ncbi:predicted protein, partial [Scheffersomyces stipitis CBS 6054]